MTDEKMKRKIVKISGGSDLNLRKIKKRKLYVTFAGEETVRYYIPIIEKRCERPLPKKRPEISPALNLVICEILKRGLERSKVLRKEIIHNRN